MYVSKDANEYLKFILVKKNPHTHKKKPIFGKQIFWHKAYIESSIRRRHIVTRRKHKNNILYTLPAINQFSEGFVYFKFIFTF